MTDRFYALTVILDKDRRDDDCENLITATRMLKGVLDVKGNIANPDTWMAESRARMDLGKKLLEIVYPKKELE